MSNLGERWLDGEEPFGCSLRRGVIKLLWRKILSHLVLERGCSEHQRRRELSEGSFTRPSHSSCSNCRAGDGLGGGESRERSGT